MLRILIVRHGETDWNVENRSQGHTDVPLNAKGRRQAEQLANALRNEAIDCVYSSDMSRTRDTACGIGLDVVEDKRLRERDYGYWEGYTFEESLANDTEARKAYDADPVLAPSGGAETGIDTFMRAASFASDLLRNHTEGTVAVITHGGLGSSLLAILLHGTPQTLSCFRLLNAAITEITIREDGRRKLVRYNDVSHLSE